MWGRATFAMAVSRTSMKAASETVTAMSQGLAAGRQIGGAAARDAAVVGFGRRRGICSEARSKAKFTRENRPLRGDRLSFAASVCRLFRYAADAFALTARS